MRKLVILGAGGNALDTLDVLDAINGVSQTWEVEGILDDRRTEGSVYLGLPVLGPLRAAGGLADRWFTSSIWNERTFRMLDSILGSTGIAAERFATLVHPGASVSNRATLGRGVVVNYGASIAGNVRVGDFVSFGPRTIVGHDTVIEGYTAIAAGAVLGGGVHVERNCYIGSSAAVRQHQRLARGCLVGLGAVVVKDVAAGTIVAGNPARPLNGKSTKEQGEQHAEQ